MTYRSRRPLWTARNVVALVLGFVVWWPLGVVVLLWIHRRTDFHGILRDELAMLRERFADLRAPVRPPEHRDGATRHEQEARKRTPDEDKRAFTEFVDRLRQARERRGFDAGAHERGKA